MDAVQDPQEKEEKALPEKEKKNLIQKIQSKIPDRNEQFEYFGLGVRFLVVLWSGSLVTLNYLPKIPGLTSGEKQDITFPASLLSSSLLSFGLEKSAKNKESSSSSNGKSNIKAELKELLEIIKLAQMQGDVKPVTQEQRIDPITNKIVDPQTGRLIP